MKSENILFGATAMAMARAFRVIIQVASLPILGRILGPHAYGQIALVTPFIYFSMLIAESGLSTCIARVKDVSETLKGTIFCFSTGFALSIMIIFAALAYPLGYILHEPQFPLLLIGMSGMLLLASFNVVPEGLLLRAKRYDILAVSDVVSAIGGIIAVTVGILLNWGVWSLVAQDVAFWFCKVCVVMLRSRYRPRILFHWQVIKENISFSANLTGASLLTFMARNVDNVLVGAFMGAEILGYYALAFQAIGLPQIIFSGSVYLTLFSSTNEAVLAGKPTHPQFLKVLRGILLVSAPIMIGVAVTSPLSVPLLLGGKWLPMVPIIFYLTPFGLMQMISVAISGVLVGLGRTNIMFWLTSIGTSITILAIFCGVHVNIYAVAAGVSFASVLNCCVGLRVVAKECGIGYDKIIGTMIAPFVSSFLMGVSVLGLQYYMAYSIPLLLHLLICILVGVLVYGLSMLVFFRHHLANDLANIKAVLLDRSKKRQ